MARGRPHGRSKSDHRVCQEARHARAAEYRERITISAEQQEARIAAVNAQCDVQDAPQKRRSQKSSGRKNEAWTARGSAQHGSCKASGNAKNKAKQRLGETLGKAAERDLHSLHCNACGATAEFGLRGGKEGGSVKYSCRAHATLNGCFRIDRDRAAWAEDREMRRLRAEERRLEEELRNLGGTSAAAKPTSAWKGSQSKGVWALTPMSQSLIATLLMIGGVERNPGPTAEEIAQGWREAFPEKRISNALLDHLMRKEVDVADWKATPREDRIEYLTRWRAQYQGPGEWVDGWDVFLKAVPSAGRRGQDVGAGHSPDVEMPDADQENQNRSKEPSGPGGLRGNQLRASGEGTWSKDVDQAVSQIMSEAFAALDEHGLLQLEIWKDPRGRREGLEIPKYKNGPSLLLHELPEQGQPGLSKADRLVAQCVELHSGEQSESGHAILVLGPSGAGKTRTIYEQLCKMYGFYHSFSTGSEPGTVVLETALRRFSAKHGPAYRKARADPDPDALTNFREECSSDVLKFVVRILLAHALGLLAFLQHFEGAATPKKFLLFQLHGAAGQKPTDWVFRIWECLLSMSYEALAGKLRDTTEKLQNRTGMAFFPVAVDEAQAGVNTPDWFPGSKKGTGRPLLSAWIRQLGLPVFQGYLFSFTGTGFAMTATSVLETGLAKQGSHLIFHEFGTFTGEHAQAFAERYLGRSTAEVKAHWGQLVAGRYRFTVQLVNFMLEDPLLRWVDAFKQLESLHTRLVDLPENQTPDNKTLIGKLQFLQREMLGDGKRKQYNEFLMQLTYLVTERYLLGSGIVLASQRVDLIELGFCFLEILGPGRTAENMWAVFKEPLPALAAKVFLEKEGLWNEEEGLRRLLMNLPSEPSALGLAWERHFPQAQRTFLEQPRLASYPLLADLPGLPSCFEKESTIICLDKGRSSREVGDHYLVRHADDEYGLIDFVQDPEGRTFLFPEIWAGPDLAHFVLIGKELWFVILQSRLRNQLRDKVHAENTVRLEQMFGGRADKVQKQEELVKELSKRNVKGILRMVVLYPGEAHLSSYAENMLRRSGRLERSHGFEVVQVVVDALNAHKYFEKKHLDLLDCLKNRPALGSSAQGGLRDDMDI